MKRVYIVLAVAFLISCTYAQVINQGLTANCKEPAGVPDQFQWGMCNCFSGYAPSSPAGDDCNTHLRCAQMTQDGVASVGGNQPLRPTTVFANDMLTVVQKAPVVSNRKASSIKFAQPLLTGVSNTPGALGGATCFYPGVLWTKTVDSLDCMDIYTAQIPWGQAGFCGFVKDTNSSSAAKDIYKTTLVHNYNETYAVNGKIYTRALSTSYLLSVSFVIQKTVTSDNFFVTIADPTVTGFIQVIVLGDAIYDVATGATLVQFRTTAAWPYSLNETAAVFQSVTPAIAGIDSSDVTITEVDDLVASCDTTQDSICTQRWLVKIGAPSTVCNIQGQYTFQDTLACRDTGVTSPCVGGTPPPVTFSLSMRKTDLCAAEAIDTSAQNTYVLTPFYAPTDSDPTFSYQTGDMIYWQFVITDPLTSIDKVTFSNIMISVTTEGGATSSDVLYSSSAITATGSAVELQTTESLSMVAPGKPVTLTFQYRLLRSALGATIAQLTTSTLTVQVTTSVTVNLYYHGNQKRSFTEKSSTATEYRTVQLIVSPEDHDAPSASAPQQQEQQVGSIFDELTSDANTIKSFVGLVVAIFVAFVLKF